MHYEKWIGICFVKKWVSKSNNIFITHVFSVSSFTVPTLQNNQFLALLDYVSRAHKIEIRPTSVRRWSVRLRHRLCLKLLHGFLSNFSCGFPCAICPNILFNFWNFFKFFLGIFFVFVNMGPYGSENFKTLLLPTNRSPKFSNFSWIFFS